MNFTFEIYKCEFCSFLLFLQGNFQEKLNKLESESENEGGCSNFSNPTFLKSLMHSALVEIRVF